MGVSKTANGGIHLNRLTDARCRNVKAGDRPVRLRDGGALMLLVQPSGSKLWRMKYRFAGKERSYSIGVFPEVSLSKAREERDRAREWLREGKDPTVERRAVRLTARIQQANTFKLVAEEWLALQPYSDRHRLAQRVKLERDLYPHLGDLPIADITPALVLETLRRIERRGTLETCAKVRRMASQIFRHAVVTSRATSDPAAFLSRALKTPLLAPAEF